MKSIPTPVAVVVVVVVVLLAGWVIYHASGNGGAASGDVKGVISDVIKSNPKNAPALPPGVDPTRGAVGRGGKK